MRRITLQEMAQFKTLRGFLEKKPGASSREMETSGFVAPAVNTAPINTLSWLAGFPLGYQTSFQGSVSPFQDSLGRRQPTSGTGQFAEYEHRQRHFHTGYFLASYRLTLRTGDSPALAHGHCLLQTGIALTPEQYRTLGPYSRLAERLGNFASASFH